MHNMLKPYKEVQPMITVNKIRSILCKIGIFVTEKYNQDGEFYTCRIDVVNDGLNKYNIGSFGKGLSIEYSSASAYAELMERLQNNVLFKNIFFFTKYYNQNCAFKNKIKSENLELEFIYCPSEKLKDVDEVVDDNFELLSKSLFIYDKNELSEFISKTLGYNKLLCVPFFCQKTNETKFLPIDLLLSGTGSTGMCAGNTPEEALIQGISEVFERYATLEVYSRKITPPTIPHDYFIEYPVFNTIKELEEKGLEIIIKDFSLGMKLPVIGLIIIDKCRRKFNVKVGSDPWPIIALERCLTEMHQSLFGIRLIDKCDYGDYLQKEWYNGLENDEAEYMNLTKIINYASGQWPDQLFINDPSYEFTGLSFKHGKSNKTDLQYLLGIIDDLGSQLYIRDVSFLDFNSYYIMLPGISQDKRRKSDYVFSTKLSELIEKINNTTLLSNIELSLLVSFLEEYYVLFKKDEVKFEELFVYNMDEDASDLTIDLYLSMAFYKLGNVEKSYSYLKEYLQLKDVQVFNYYYAIKDYLALKKDGKNDCQIRSYLQVFYVLDLVNEVCEDMSDANKVFDEHNLFWYFNCIQCNVEDFGYYKSAEILKKVQIYQKEQKIDQNNLASVFL